MTESAGKTECVQGQKSSSNYWESRRELVYYSTLANFVRIIGYQANSFIDVGSAGCEYIKWFHWIPDRASLDIAFPTRGDGIRSIEADFFQWLPDKSYDVVVCTQVLEHIEDAPAFARKLLSIGRRLLISVPHKWPAGSVKEHVHDPVDQGKVDSWFGRKPSYSLLVREPFAEERLMCYYRISGPLLNLNSTLIEEMLARHPIER